MLSAGWKEAEGPAGANRAPAQEDGAGEGAESAAALPAVSENWAGASLAAAEGLPAGALLGTPHLRGAALWRQQFRALFTKRLLCAKRDRMAALVQASNAPSSDSVAGVLCCAMLC